MIVLLILLSCSQSGKVHVYDNKAPDFTLPDVNNKNVSLSDFEGKVVLIDFGLPGANLAEEQIKNLLPFTKNINIIILKF